MELTDNNKDIYSKVTDQLSLIENELKKLGNWQETPPDPKIFENMGAFGSNTMPFTTWLQFVFIPNVKQIITQQGAFPKSSSVATYAYRNLEEGVYTHLNSLLSDFDALFDE